MIHTVVVLVAEERAGIPIVIQPEAVERVEVRCVVIMVGMRSIRSIVGGVLVSSSLVFKIADDFFQGIVLPSKVLCLDGLGSDGFVTLILKFVEVVVVLSSHLHDLGLVVFMCSCNVVFQTLLLIGPDLFLLLEFLCVRLLALS